MNQRKMLNETSLRSKLNTEEGLYLFSKLYSPRNSYSHAQLIIFFLFSSVFLEDRNFLKVRIDRGKHHVN